MLILDWKYISSEIKNELKKRILKLNEKGINPGLGIILVGNKPDSKIYVRMKKKACNEIGIINYDVNLEEMNPPIKIMSKKEK